MTVVFQEGFQLKYTDEDKVSTPTRQAKAVVDNGIQVSKQMLRELNLGDAVPGNISDKGE